MRGMMFSKFVKNQWVDVVMSILAQFYFLFPWIQTESGNYNVIMYLARGFWLQDFSSMLRMDFPALKVLEERGLINLTFAEGSRKSKVASLTVAGAAFSETYIVPAAQAEQRRHCEQFDAIFHDVGFF